MIHGFQYMGVPEYVLTDNMKIVVLHRDLDGNPVWQPDYEAFMRTVGFKTKLCKPRHPFTNDGFVNYEGRRFGVPYRYVGSVVRVMRQKETFYIYSADLTQLLVTHEVTWSKRDSFCKDQYVALEQPEEFPTMSVKTQVKMLPAPDTDISFEKFNFDKGADWDN